MNGVFRSIQIYSDLFLFALDSLYMFVRFLVFAALKLTTSKVLFPVGFQIMVSFARLRGLRAHEPVALDSWNGSWTDLKAVIALGRVKPWAVNVLRDLNSESADERSKFLMELKRSNDNGTLVGASRVAEVEKNHFKRLHLHMVFTKKRQNRGFQEKLHMGEFLYFRFGLECPSVKLGKPLPIATFGRLVGASWIDATKPEKLAQRRKTLARRVLRPRRRPVSRPAQQQEEESERHVPVVVQASCPICLEVYSRACPRVLSGCGHAVCRPCSARLQRIPAPCAICRLPVQSYITDFNFQQ